MFFALLDKIGIAVHFLNFQLRSQLASGSIQTYFVKLRKEPFQQEVFKLSPSARIKDVARMLR
jgi:hypothetical protein